MSVEEIRWSPWLDDMERIIESMTNGLELLSEDNSSEKGIEIIKNVLHSIKGLYDSVGLRTSTQTIFELEENVHQSKKKLGLDLIEMLFKASEKVKEMTEIIRSANPSPDEVPDLDKRSGFEAILIKFESEYKVEIDIGGDRSLRSARGLAVYNTLKRHAVIKSSSPPEEDLYLDVKFDQMVMIILTRDEVQEIKKKIASLPNVTNVDILKIEKKKTAKSDKEDITRDLSIRVPLSNIRKIENSLAVLSMHIESMKAEITTKTGQEEIRGIDDSIERIQNDLKKIRKVPLDSITTTFPAMVKRLAKQEKKQIDFVIQGRFITLDRSLANQIIDPITQIIRNAVSHGIEDPVTRRKLEKEIVGKISIDAKFDRNKISIDITDDGGGINREEILKRAKKIDADLPDDMTDQEIINLIFHSGFSMAKGTSKISGRGLGLSSAKERIQQIGGTLSVTSDFEKGTTFTIEFSDPDALTRNLIFTVSDETYAVPTSEVEKVIIISHNDLDFKSDKMATYDYEGQTLPVNVMRKILSNGNGNSDEIDRILLVCRGKDNLLGLLVDSLVDDRLVNVKPLNPLLQDYELFNGTLSGRGREVILVVNPAAIM